MLITIYEFTLILRYEYFTIVARVLNTKAKDCVLKVRCFQRIK